MDCVQLSQCASVVMIRTTGTQKITNERKRQKKQQMNINWKQFLQWNDKLSIEKRLEICLQ